MTDAQGQPVVLVVDDEQVVHASLQRILSRQGYRVEAALSARAVLDLLESWHYELVITDLMMPEMNGIELLQALRARAIDTPVIVITGYPTIRTAVQAMRLGARDYVSKPFTRKELLGPVLRALRQEQAAAALEREPSADAPDAGSLLPGATVYLPHHSWARFEQDGHFAVGVERSFLAAVGQIVDVALAAEAELIEQGAVSMRLTTAEGEEHGVASPLSGRVVSVNSAAVADPALLGPGTWLLRILPRDLHDEVGNLRLR